eukprot:CAMPEP_0171935296 /NCGR_PEP_ID=MMETSP0993-20121228/32772_1 /TAXON_ID=483369 /ORGANISM="non described non described, Strain CCMP2098" /LENGTH=336 /DNA_ID=CAMNT_0012576187 /DNA_START=62 /DNA_END=1072 /DNA_ORIENTATION=-
MTLALSTQRYFTAPHLGGQHSKPTCLTRIPRLQVRCSNEGTGGGVLAPKEVANSPNDPVTHLVAATPEKRAWKLPGLRTECERLALRQLKKVGNAERRHSKAIDSGSEDDLKISEYLIEVEAAQERLDALTQMEADLAALGKKGKVDGDLEARLLELEVGDSPPQRQPQGPKKKKGPRASAVAPRKPYRSYASTDGIEILVGRSAKDNDELSIDPERKYRHQNDWWMHVAGSPGSHVVIRSTTPGGGAIGLEDIPRSTMMDAAALAAKYSKAGASRAKVTVVRCRDISKPSSMKLKPGMVLLSPGAETNVVKVDLKQEAGRLERLEAQQETGGDGN